MSKPRPKIRGHKRSCGTKQKFETQEAAAAAAYRRRDYMHAYKCPKCKKWHFGHPTKPEHWK